MNIILIGAAEEDIGTTKQRYCFLDYLIKAQMQDPELMTDEGIREEVDTFMAGVSSINLYTIHKK